MNNYSTQMVDKSELAIATSQTQNPILYWIIIQLIVSNDYYSHSDLDWDKIFLLWKSFSWKSIPFLFGMTIYLPLSLLVIPWVKILMPLIFFMFYRINLFNLLAQNSNDNSCIFLYYMPEVPNVGYNSRSSRKSFPI